MEQLMIFEGATPAQQEALSMHYEIVAGGAVIAALVSAWWLCAVIEGTAGGVTGPLVLSGVCAWLARALARAAERGYVG